MKKTFFMALVLSGQVFATDIKVEVQQFNFKYEAPHGEGEALVFNHNMKGIANSRVTVEKIEEDFKVSLSGSQEDEFVFKNAPAFVKNAESMYIANFNLLLNDKAALAVDSASFIDKKNELGLSSFNLNCNRDMNQVENMDQFIAGCITQMVLKASKVSTGSTTVKAIDFKSTGGKFNLGADIKAAISGRIKGTGTLAYDSAKGLLTVKVSEVKLGILNVTGTVFKELKKLDSEKVKVSNPYVYVTIK